MYKTVRHGENSLQYKILAQQEEGVAAVKCRRSARAVTAKFVAVVAVLACGVIASAVLVPMVLTDDFVALTGTFQKFSVSTLRRSHSGNRVAVIARKPYGWNASRATAPQVSGSSEGHSLRANKLTEAAPTTSRDAGRATGPGGAADGATTAKPPLAEHGDAPSEPGGEPPPENLRPGESVFRKPPTPDDPSSAPPPLRPGGPRQSDSGSPVTVVAWLQKGSPWSRLSAAGGVLLSVLLVAGLVLALRRKLSRRRTSAEESAEYKEDNARLLKSSVRGSDEE